MRIGLGTSVATAIAIGVAAIVIGGGGGGGGGTVPTTANLFVVASGGTPSCVRSSTLIAFASAVAGNKCDSLDAAYQAATDSGGDTVLIEAGSYGDMTISPDSGKTSANDTVFAGDGTRSAVIFGTICLGTCGYGGTDVSHITLWNLTATQGIDGRGTTGAPYTDDITINSIDGGSILGGGWSNILVENSDLGPCSPDGAFGYLDCGPNHPVEGDTQHLTFFNNVIHGYRITPFGVAHYECVFLQPNAASWAVSDDIRFLSNTFYDCDFYDLVIESLGATNLITNWVVKNNFFGMPWDGSNGPRFSALNIQTANPVSGITVAFNSFDRSGFEDDSSGGSSDVFIGNIFGAAQGCTVGTGAVAGSYSYNIYANQATTCSGTAEAALGVGNFPAYTRTEPSSTDHGAFDGHLTGGTTSIDNFIPSGTCTTYVTTDIDAATRPAGASCDAGADER